VTLSWLAKLRLESGRVCVAKAGVSLLDTATAEHEAAHVVVGLALGLKLRKATIRPTPHGKSGIALGYVWFYSGRKYLAQAIMCCAGVVWDERSGFDVDTVGDLATAKKLVSRGDVATCMSIARELLDGRRRLHARIASELCDRDLSGADVDALAIES
jgi:hypothetical protein